MSGGDRGAGLPGGDRCIVWHRRGVSPDSELLGALERKGLSVVAYDNAYEAFAHLCLLGSRHVAIGPGRVPKTVLLLSEPELLPEVADVVTLAERYAPRGVCWTFEPHADGAGKRIRIVAPEDAQRWARAAKPAQPPIVTLAKHLAARKQGRAREGTSPADSLVAAIGGPRLRLAGEGQLPPAPEPEPDELSRVSATGRGASSENQSGEAPAAGAPGAPVLTEQELAMLLAKEPLPEQD